MGGLTAPGTSAVRRRDSAVVAALLVVAAAAWVGTVAVAGGMGATPGAMGMALPAFLAVWLLMMAAMMLPAVAPVARLYLRTITASRPQRVGLFLTGYLAVWTAAGVPAFGLAVAAGWAAQTHPTAAQVAAVGTFLGVAAYQLSPLKDMCLRACRSPLGLLLRYSSYGGRFRDLRVGWHHGLYCLGCCWALFAALLALGTMNLLPMVVLATVVAGEKLWGHGVALSRGVAVAAALLAAAVAVHPQLAAGLYAAPMPAGM